MKYLYEINIEANTEEDADKKIQALTVIASKLSSTELQKLAHIIKTDPVKTAMAKQYLKMQ